MTQGLKLFPQDSLRHARLPALILFALAAGSILLPHFPLQAAPSTNSIPAAQPSKFVGEWTASFQDKVFMTLWIHHSSGKWTGELSNGEVDFDADGNLTSATARPGKKSIHVDKVEGDTLSFSYGADPVRHADFKLTGSNHGQLSFVVPSGNVGIHPKPFVMTRSTAGK